MTVTFFTSFLFAEMDYQIYSYGQPYSDLTGQGNYLYFVNSLGITQYNPLNNEKSYFQIPGVNPEQIGNILVDNLERVWFITRTIGDTITVNCFDGESLTVYKSGKVENSMYYLKFYMDNSDNIWVGTYTNGLLYFNTHNYAWNQFDQTNTGVQLSKVSTIFQDVTDGSFWIGSWEYGLFHYQNNTWTQTTSMNGIPVNFITDICQLEDGTLWVGCHDGLLRIMNNTCERIGDYYKIEELETFNNYVFFSCYESSLHLIDSYLSVYPLDIGGINDLFAFNGHLYVNNGYSVLKSGNNYYDSYDYEILYPGNYHNPLYFESIRVNKLDNALWTKNGNSLSVRKNNTWTYFNGENTSINFTELINFNFTSEGHLICFMQGSGNLRFIKYDGVNWTIYPQIECQNPFYNIYPDHDNKIWFGSYDSKLHYSVNNQIYQKSFSQLNPANYNQDLMVDEENNIWFLNDYDLYYYNQNTDQLQLVRSNVKNYYAVNPNEYFYISNEFLYSFNNGNVINYGAIPEFNTQMLLDANQNICVIGAFQYYTVEDSELMVYNLPSYNNNYNTPSFAIDNNNNKFYRDYNKLIAFNETQAVSNDDNVASPVNDKIRIYPNPFNPDTHISFTLNQANSVEINIYNIKGQLVKRYPKSYFNAGEHTLFWNGKDNQNKFVSSGIYFIRLISPEYQGSKKAMLLK